MSRGARVLLSDPIDEAGVAHLRAHGVEAVEAPDSSPATLRRLARDADAAILRSALPDDVFEVAPRLRAILVHGTGADLVPLAAATRHGVAVGNLPGANAQSVAEYCAMAILVLARGLVPIVQTLRKATWDAARALAAGAHEIAGRTAGIVGAGEIGRRVAAILRGGFGMRVLGHRRHPERMPEGLEPAGLEELLADSDFVVLACPLTPETHHLIDARRLARMKPSAWLVNVGRGAVVDEAALVAVLRERRIAGAMLDVFEHYRLERNHALLALDNVVATPHLAGSTVESRARMGRLAAEEVLRMLAGEAPRHFLNPEVWSRFRERRPQDR